MNPYNTPVTVTIRRVLTASPNWIGGEDPEVLTHEFADLQEAYLFCVKEANLDESEIRGSSTVELHGWSIIPFARLKEIVSLREEETFYTEDEQGDYISMRLSYSQ